MECLVLHEDHVTNFKTTHEVFYRGTEVATSGPHILNESDVVGVNSERLCQPTVVELDALILEEVPVILLVEHLNAHHDEARVMAAGEANVVQIIEASAKLWADERVSGWVKLTSHTVGLEAEDTGSNVVNIVSPARHDGVALDRVARNACTRQASLEAYPQK